MGREKIMRKTKAGLRTEAGDRGSLSRRSFPIAGAGASAGGLESFERLLKALPHDTGMAFVLVQHLDPTHASQLTGILSHATKMPVTEVTDRMKVLPNHVYIIPPNRAMRIQGRVLHLEPRRDKKTPNLPIDFFFRSLAAEHKNKAIGVILSGTASDGAAGMRAIKDSGGITFAQDTHSAKYPGMPRSAVASGAVDFVLPPEQIATYLARIGNHPYVTLPEEPVEPEVAPPAGSEAPAAELFGLLKRSFGVDFNAYKFSTINRRIRRRTALQGVESLPRYLGYVKEKPQELRALFQDMFIGVTEFFRDPGMFRQLNRLVFPALLKHRPAESAIRIWVPGCSTGEEVYSIAIALLDYLKDRANSFPIQIFGSDVDEEAIQRARRGRYGKEIVKNVGQTRLRRYFTTVESGYQLSKGVRDLCIFARHDVMRDALFSRLDLLSCRNLLIYLNHATHRKLISLFHYTLKPSGFLVLGSAETIGGFSDLFSLKDRKYKIYARKAVAARPYFEIPAERVREIILPEALAQPPIPRNDFEWVKEAADHLILNHYGPPAVLVGENLDILHFRGHTGPFLEPAPGVASLNLLKMAREGLLVGLRAATDSARKKNSPAEQTGLRMDSVGGERIVNIRVVPIRTPGRKERTFLVLFEEAKPEAAAGKKPAVSAGQGARRTADEQRIGQLKQELSATKAYLHSVIENQEATNEELRSLNEEVHSTNEELQSTTEELETANEELQSANEELNTLNEEIQNRNQQLSVVNNDLLNLLNGLDLIVFMLDRDLRVRRFTPAAQEALNLAPGDLGHALSKIRALDDLPGLETSIVEVMETARPQERDTQDRQGHWFTLQVRPYIAMDGKIDGAIVILYDIDILKRHDTELGELNVHLRDELAHRKNAEETAQGMERRFRVVADSLNERIFYVDADLRIQFSNRPNELWWGIPRESLIGRYLPDLIGAKAYQQRRYCVEGALAGRPMTFEGYAEYEGRPTRYIRADFIPEFGKDGKVTGLYVVKKDMTELKQAEEKFQAIIESAPDAIVLTDEDGRIVLVNGQAESLFRWYRDDLMGKPVEVLLPARFRKQHVSHRASYLLNPSARPMGEKMDLFCLRANGSEVPVEVNLSPLRTSSTVMTCAIIRDVSQQRALAQERKQTAVLGERHRLARDVHDTLAQGFAGVVVQLEAAEASYIGRPEEALRHVTYARELAQSNLDEARRSVLSLSERQVETPDLAEALQELVGRLREITPIRLELSVRGKPRRLDASIEENLLGITRQAIDNAIQHSRAKTISAELAFEKERVRIQISDDGRGFAPSKARGGFGLRSMQDRARQCGGKLDLVSKPGKGTRVAVAIPLGRVRGGTKPA